MGWTNPSVIGSIVGGVVLLVAFVVIERRVAEPMFQLGLFRIRAFAAGSVAGLIAAVARGGLQFMLIIWLQGIWLPLHGYSYIQTPLWAGHLPAAADHRVPDLGSGLRATCRTGSAPGASPPPACSCSARASSA